MLRSLICVLLMNPCTSAVGQAIQLTTTYGSEAGMNSVIKAFGTALGSTLGKEVAIINRPGENGMRAVREFQAAQPEVAATAIPALVQLGNRRAGCPYEAEAWPRLGASSRSKPAQFRTIRCREESSR